MCETQIIEGVTFKAGAMVRAHEVAGFLIAVKNEAGRVFNIRLVRRGEHYGLNDCLTHKEDSPMVEFFDSTFANKPGPAPYQTRTGFGPLGQFVSRYYAATLKADAADLESRGLDLHGGVGCWKVSGMNMREVFRALESI